jgi:carbamoyltransferase
MTEKYIIGISAYYHDSSVAVFINDRLLFACEEEKFTGIKHDSSFPFNALNYVYKKYKLDRNKIEAICFYENPELKFNRVKNNIKNKFLTNPIYCLNSFFDTKQNINNIKKELFKISDNVFYSIHHESHIYYSYHTSNFKNSIVLSIDGVGEIDTAVMGIPNENGFHTMSLAKYPHSLGLFYSAMTSFLGFKPNEGEYKVMGLSAYGDHTKFIDKVRKLITYEDGNLVCNMNVFSWDRSDKLMFNEKLCSFLETEPRLPESEIEITHKDLAAAVQKRYEEVLFEMIDLVGTFTNQDTICLSGGCAYNGLANGKITKNTKFKDVWIPVAPSDAGSAVGACLKYLKTKNRLKNNITQNPFLGPIFPSLYREKEIKRLKHIEFYSDSNLKKFIAKKIREGNVVGWFTGSCEFGSRALGNRSILADPTIKGMRDKINKVIKKREGFRPFAPMVIKEKQHMFFDIDRDIPYMNTVVNVIPEYIDILSEVTHVDGTARVQTVYKTNRIYDLLLEFEKLSKFPILLNTSFNIKDKTMVLTPQDAIKTFLDTEMDILVIDNYVIFK